jgi:hypothetical protein
MHLLGSLLIFEVQPSSVIEHCCHYDWEHLDIEPFDLLSSRYAWRKHSNLEFKVQEYCSKAHSKAIATSIEKFVTTVRSVAYWNVDFMSEMAWVRDS